MGVDVNMSDQLINTNISQYVNSVRSILPAETLGFTDMNDNTRRQSQAQSQRCNNPSQISIQVV